MYWKLLKNGGWEVKGYGSVMEGVEWTKGMLTHSKDTLRNPFENHLKY
jgi:hypothetical protein